MDVPLSHVKMKRKVNYHINKHSPSPQTLFMMPLPDKRVANGCDTDMTPVLMSDIRFSSAAMRLGVDMSFIAQNKHTILVGHLK